MASKSCQLALEGLDYVESSVQDSSIKQYLLQPVKNQLLISLCSHLRLQVEAIDYSFCSRNHLM